MFRCLEHLCIRKRSCDASVVKARAIPNEAISEMILTVNDSCRQPFLQRLQHVYVEGVFGVLLMLRDLLLDEVGHLRVFVPWDRQAIAAMPSLYGFAELRR